MITRFAKGAERVYKVSEKVATQRSLGLLYVRWQSLLLMRDFFGALWSLMRVPLIFRLRFRSGREVMQFTSNIRPRSTCRPDQRVEIYHSLLYGQ